MTEQTQNLLGAVVFDRTSSVPLHHQLFLELRRLLTEGDLQPGTALPRVAEICHDLNVSTITVSRAVAELKREGLVVTRRGAGIYVAERAAPVTEVLLCPGGGTPGGPGSFQYALVEGLRKGMDEPLRRCILTHYGAQPPSLQEVKDLMTARRADSLVVYRPVAPMMDLLRVLARTCPTVVVFVRPANCTADCVLAAPEQALRAVLEKQIKAGGRQFAYFGKKGLEATGSESPYQRLHEEFLACMSRARLTPTVQVLEDLPRPEGGRDIARDDALLAEQARGLPADTVVVAETPHLARQVLDRNPALRLIAYTESPDSVAQARKSMTVLFIGLEDAGVAAAKLLRERLRNPQLAARTLELRAKVVGPDAPAT